jgi:DNA polymerase III epsilon subunit-like protein
MINEEQLQVLNKYIAQVIRYIRDNNRFIVYDLETNGLLKNPMPSVLSISAEKCRLLPNKTIEIIDTYARYYYSVEPYDPRATKVNGLTDEYVIKQKRGKDDNLYPMYFLNDISSFKLFCEDAPVYIGYNNTGFDNIYLEEHMIFPHSLDIMVVQSKIENKPNRKLKEVAPDYGIITDEAELHQSSYDVYLTRSIFSSMLKLSPVRMVALKE